MRGLAIKKQVVSVDPWEILPGIVNIDDYVEMETTDLFAVYLENMKLLGFNPRPYQPHEYGPQYLVSEAAKAVNLFEDNSVDMFFDDGDHFKVKETSNDWMPKIKPGGIYSGHDYGWDSVRESVAELSRNLSREVSIAETIWSVII
jgi:hypothetical protein